MSDYATEAGHWYDREGNPCYTVIAKGNGLPRNTTLGDAKKMNLVPSVTNIMSIIAKPNLINWMKNQIIDACIFLPMLPDESVEAYKTRVFEEAERFMNERRDEGTAIHSAIDRGFLHGEDNIYFNNVKALIDEIYPNRLWVPEKSFACHLGYGGKCDLSSNQFLDGSEAYPITIDYKSKDFKDDDNPKKFIYDEHGMQLSAYGYGLFNCLAPTRLNIFVRPSDGKCLPYHHSENNDLDKFKALLAVWQVMKNYQSQWSV